jgi:hypothetical protein
VVANVVDGSNFLPGFIVFAVMFLAAVGLACSYAYAICGGVRRRQRGLDR